VATAGKTEGHTWLRIDLLEGGRYVGTLLRAVNWGYDALPSRSAKFNSERDNSNDEGGVAKGAEWLTEFWTKGRTRAWVLGQTPFLHAYGHYFEARAVRACGDTRAS